MSVLTCPTCGGTGTDEFPAHDGIAHIGACPDRHPPTAWGRWYRDLEARAAERHTRTTGHGTGTTSADQEAS